MPDDERQGKDPGKNNAETTPAAKPVPTDAEIEKQIKDQFAQSRKILDVLREIL